jgi:iron complex transport system permease protein
MQASPLKIERQQQHTVHEKSAHRVLWVGLLAAGLSLALLVAGLAVGSTGWQNLGALWRDPIAAQIVWDIRLPRTLGAWLAGALLGLAGAVAQGLFRNPLADPYLLGSAAGANLGVAVAMAAFGGTPFATALVVRWGLTGAAFVGATVAVFITLTLAKGVQQGLRLLLAGVIVGVVLTALSSLVLISRPDILPAMQSFLLGSTAFVGWSACAVLLGTLAPCVLAGWGLSRALDALALGEDTARTLGLRLALMRMGLIGVLALATGAAVAQAGLISFVGLAAPHLVRSLVRVRHAGLLMLSALLGGVLLAAADLLARGLVAPQELPVGVLTAMLGGGYLLWLMHRGRALH